MSSGPNDWHPTVPVGPPSMEPPNATQALRVPPCGSLLDGTYRIEGILGSGGMGVVLLAEDERLRRKVAIKVIKPEFARRPRALERFLKEARTMATLRAQNVVQIFALGEYEELPYFVMEYVEGNTVDDWLLRHHEGGAPPHIDEAIGILEQVCRGITSIHEAGVIHADIKPGNVLIGSLFRVAVTDFGLVRDLGEKESQTIVAGTPAYIPPEVVLSSDPELQLTRGADVYGLGVMAYEMLTGRMPWVIETISELFDVHSMERAAALPSEVRRDLAPAFDPVIMRSIERDPARRFQSADEFRRALMAARETVARPSFPMRFVVADDDEDFLDLAAETLDFAFPGADIEKVSNGEAALAAIDRKPASLAVIDLDLPQMNGLELTAALRATSNARHMPILVVTGSGSADDWRLLSSLGADGYLMKPLDPYALVALARRTIGVSMFPPSR